RRVDARTRAKHRGRNPVKADSARSELHQDRDGSVRLRPRSREEAIRDFTLDHDAPALERGRPLERLHDERRRDVVGNVGDELRWNGAERLDVEVERVAPGQRDVRMVAERPSEARLERAVEFDGMDELDAIGEEAGEDPEPRADLEYDVAGSQIAQTAHDAEDVLVDEEVLAERLLGCAAHGRRSAAMAFASVPAARSSRVSPRASASVRSVCTTLAGSFRSPRTACGARYGLSVSTSIRSGGISAAAARRSFAFG